MALIRPFAGIHYRRDRVGPLDTVVAPPYDVMSPERRAELLSQNLNNIVRVDMPVGQGDAKYRYAGDLWRRWLATGVLGRDTSPALYLVEERYTAPSGKTTARIGFIAELLLEELGEGSVLPHERTFSGPKADRLRLLEETRANTSPVFLLYRDPDFRLRTLFGRMMNAPPDEGVTTAESASSMWRVLDPRAQSEIAEVVSRHPITVADGHHRYETAVTYRNRQRARGIRGGAEALMVYLTNGDDPTLTILPSHRMVRVFAPFDEGAFLGRLNEHFDLSDLASEKPLTLHSQMLGEGTGEPYCLGIATSSGRNLFARLKAWAKVARWIDHARSPAWRRLDVSLLHEVVLKQLAGLTEDQVKITYTTDVEAGYAALSAGTIDLFFLLRPTSAAQVAEVAEAGDVMPHKSTYFSPKPVTGLVMRTLDD